MTLFVVAKVFITKELADSKAERVGDKGTYDQSMKVYFYRLFIVRSIRSRSFRARKLSLNFVRCSDSLTVRSGSTLLIIHSGSFCSLHWLSARFTSMLPVW